MKDQVVYQDRLCDYNMTKPSETEKRMRMLKEMLAECGEGITAILKKWSMRITI